MPMPISYRDMAMSMMQQADPAGDVINREGTFAAKQDENEQRRRLGLMPPAPFRSWQEQQVVPLRPGTSLVPQKIGYDPREDMLRGMMAQDPQAPPEPPPGNPPPIRPIVPGKMFRERGRYPRGNPIPGLEDPNIGAGVGP